MFTCTFEEYWGVYHKSLVYWDKLFKGSATMALISWKPLRYIYVGRNYKIVNRMLDGASTELFVRPKVIDILNKRERKFLFLWNAFLINRFSKRFKFVYPGSYYRRPPKYVRFNFQWDDEIIPEERVIREPEKLIVEKMKSYMIL